MGHYYAKWIEESGSGRWNVIQILNEQARYFVLKSAKLEANAQTGPFLGHGWIVQEEDVTWFTDSEDYIDISDWEKQEGILIPF